MFEIKEKYRKKKCEVATVVEAEATVAIKVAIVEYITYTKKFEQVDRQCWNN